MKYAIAVVVIILLVVAGVFFVNSTSRSPQPTQQTNTQNPTVTQAIEQSNPSTESAMMGKTVIKLTNEGFVPNSVTIKQGEAVTFENDSDNPMWVASAVHPAHSAYDGTTLKEHCANPTTTTFDECKGEPKGTSYSFTFTKVGKWAFHDHLQPTFFGSVTVQ